MLAPLEIAKKSVTVGQTKAKLPWAKMLLLGILAGMFIALAGVGSTFANATLGRLAGACVFPAGLAMVVVAGSELFTGNNLMITACLSKKITWKALLRNWGIVFLGNFIGALAITVLVVLSGALGSVTDTVIATASAKVNLSFAEALLRGILCNFLVCVAVWMAFGAETVAGKIAAVFFPVMLFVLCGFEHSIANMYFIPAGIMEAARTGVEVAGLNFGTFLLNNLLPVTLGNIIGGAGVVGVIYWGVYLKPRSKKRR